MGRLEKVVMCWCDDLRCDGTHGDSEGYRVREGSSRGPLQDHPDLIQLGVSSPAPFRGPGLKHTRCLVNVELS